HSLRLSRHADALVYGDLLLQFYGALLRASGFVGHRLRLKAASSSVTIFSCTNEIVAYPRCWRRGQTLGADSFELALAQLSRVIRRTAGSRSIPCWPASRRVPGVRCAASMSPSRNRQGRRRRASSKLSYFPAQNSKDKSLRMITPDGDLMLD